MGVLVQVLRGGLVSESLYLLVVSLFCGSFGEGDTPTGGAGGLSSVRGGVLLRASSARRVGRRWWHEKAAQCF